MSCYLACFNIGIGMHSTKLNMTKSETKCITIMGTVNSLLAHAPAIVKQQLNSLPTADATLLANKDTNSRSRWALHYVEAIFGLGLELL